MRKRLLILLALAAGAAAGWTFRATIAGLWFSVWPPQVETVSQGAVKPDAAFVSTVAENLKTPWEIAFLPDGGMLVSERPGTLRKIGANSFLIPVPDVRETAEGGLLGMALHPDFVKNGWIYLYLTTENTGRLTNRVDRYRLDGSRLLERTTIVQGIPGGDEHDGGRIAFGPDGKLYIGTGDSGNAPLSQDRSSLAGKILRLNDDGTIPNDNPYNNETYAYGLRNVEGLTWDRQGRLWATDHGRSGILSGLDEINLIESGKNYGWPNIQGDETAEGMVAPKIHSGPFETWAPAGMAFFQSSLFFTGLRGQALYQAVINPDDSLTLSAHFEKQFGRLRAIKVGPDGMLYVSTSNTDGRGLPKKGDDRIMRIDPRIFSR